MTVSPVDMPWAMSVSTPRAAPVKTNPRSSEPTAFSMSANRLHDFVEPTRNLLNVHPRTHEGMIINAGVVHEHIALGFRRDVILIELWSANPDDWFHSTDCLLTNDGVRAWCRLNDQRTGKSVRHPWRSGRIVEERAPNRTCRSKLKRGRSDERAADVRVGHVALGQSPRSVL